MRGYTFMKKTVAGGVATLLALGLAGFAAMPAAADEVAPEPTAVVDAVETPVEEVAPAPEPEAAPVVEEVASIVEEVAPVADVVEGETTTALLAGGVLLGSNNPAEALWGGGWGEAYKVVNATGGCTPPVTNTYCEVPADGPTSTDLNDLWSNVDTRSAGHVEYVNDGLHIYTDDNSSNAKVSEGYGASFDLKNTGALDLDWTGSTPPPGINLFVTFEDGKNGTLVYESVYGQDLWLTNGSNADVKANAPVNGGGNGSQWHGTIDQWLSVYPNAHVNGIAYSLGSGVLGDGVINSITAGCTTYYFDKVDTIEVTPPLVVVENGEWTGSPECGVTEFDQTRTVTTTTTTYHVEVVEGAYVNVADEPTVVVGEPETRTVETEATPCPVTVVTPPTQTPTPVVALAAPAAPQGLASTGAEVLGISAAAAILLIAGAASVLIGTRRRKVSQ